MASQTIEIDWDIHKAIEAERRGFDEPPHIALRRLIGLPEIPRTSLEAPASYRPTPAGIPWIEDGIEVPHGSLARMEYNYGKQKHEGQFLDGMLVVNGQKFRTLSSAANAVAVTRAGGKTQLNGWNYWFVKFPEEKQWRSLGEMRMKLRQKAKGGHFG